MAGSNCFGIWWRGWWSWNCATVKKPTGWYVYVPRSRWAIHLWRATLPRLFRRTCQGKCSGKPTALPDRFDGSRHWGHWLLLDSVKLCSSSDLPSRIGYDSLEPWGHLALSERILNVLNLRNNSGSFWPSSKRCILEEGSRLCSLVFWTPPPPFALIDPPQLPPIVHIFRPALIAQCISVDFYTFNFINISIQDLSRTSSHRQPSDGIGWSRLGNILSPDGKEAARLAMSTLHQKCICRRRNSCPAIARCLALYPHAESNCPRVRPASLLVQQLTEMDAVHGPPVWQDVVARPEVIARLPGLIGQKLFDR